MTAGGTIVVSAPAAGVVADLAGNLNLASNTSGNSIAYVDAGRPSSPPDVCDRPDRRHRAVGRGPAGRRVRGTAVGRLRDRQWDAPSRGPTTRPVGNSHMGRRGRERPDIQIPIIDLETPIPDETFIIGLANGKPGRCDWKPGDEYCHHPGRAGLTSTRIRTQPPREI